MRQKPTSLAGLPAKKLTTGQRKLQRFGIDPDRWIAMLGAGDAEMQKLVAAWPQAGLFYGADSMGKMFGTKVPNIPVPESVPGRAIVYLPEELASDLANLRRAKAAAMWDQDWYDGRYKATPGYHEVVLPLPESNRKTNTEQSAFVPQVLPGFGRTPGVVAAVLLLAHKLSTGEDLLKGAWLRCPEEAPNGRQLALTFGRGRLLVADVWRWDGLRDGLVWASASRELPS